MKFTTLIQTQNKRSIKKHHFNGQKTFRAMVKNLTIGFVLVSMLCGSMLLGACTEKETIDPVMVVGPEGVDFAKSLITRYPYRKAYSEQEKSAALLIGEELEDMGYKPEVVPFGTEGALSQNIIVTIPGSGFQSENSSSGSIQVVTTKKQVIVCAHYDTIIGIEEEATYPEYDGIQGNASGVGALISVAKELKNRNNGYDVVLVFLGAGYDNFAGANNYFAGMTRSEIKNTDAVYCIDSIYAGDKLYAHSGNNSIQPGRKYEFRRKLYEISDVAIANTIDLRFNESDLDVDVNGDGTLDVYREITVTRSDYTVFDNAGIPCVFLESFDYFGASQDLQVESKNPAFGTTSGKIRGTNFDSLATLTEVLGDERLESRIKNTAFLIVEAIKKGIYQAASSSGSLPGSMSGASQPASSGSEDSAANTSATSGS